MMYKYLSVFGLIIENTICWILILLFLPIPLFLIISYKVIVTRIAKILHSNWSSFSISDGMTLFDIPNLYTKPLFSVGFIIKLKSSEFSITEFRKIFVKQLLEPTKCDNAEIPVPLHKNLFCFIRTFGGFPFKESLKYSDLNIEELITEHEILDLEESLNDFHCDFYYKAYELGKPMWNISVVKVKKSVDIDADSESEQLYIFFRIHHVLGDGYSFTYVLEQLSTGEKFVTMKIDEKDNFGDFDENWKEKIKLIASAPGKLVDQAYRLIGLGSIPKFMKMRGIHTKMNYFYQSLDIQTIKTISKKSGTNFQSVLLTLLSGFTRKFLLEIKAIPYEKNLPEYVYSMYPLPWPHPKGKICNEWVLGMFKTPFRTPNPQERLLKTDKDYREYHDKGMNKLWRLGEAPCFWSAMAAGANYKILGNDITHIYPFGGMGAPRNAIYFASMTHSGKIDVIIGINREFFPNRELAKQFVNEFIKEELETLERIYAGDNKHSEYLEIFPV